MRSENEARVAIIGGGVGGLCLAQSLVKSGMNVRVYERDRTPADRLQGYRVHIDPHGARALHDCLPPELWRAFLATTGRGGQDFAFLTEQLSPLLLIPAEEKADPADSHHSVSRITLRQVLLSGMDEVVRFGKTFERYSRNTDDSITLHFSDGSSSVADIVVAADGGNSRVRRQYLPHAQRIDTGITTVAGKFPLTDETRKLISSRLWEGPNNVIPPKGAGFFLAPHDLSGPALRGGIGATEQEGALHDNTSSYILWAFGAAQARFPGRIGELPGVELRNTVAGMIQSWHGDLLRLVTMSDPETVSLLPIRTSVPIDAWEPSNITLLGDAIHSMTPMRGIGANTALRDARLLGQALASGEDHVAAIASYEAEMREYGFGAVRESLQAARQFVSENRVARAGFKAFLRTAERFPSLKQKVFS